MKKNTVSNNMVTELLDIDLERIDNIKNSIDSIIRKNEPDCEYKIRCIKLSDDANYATAVVETPSNEMILDYNFRLDCSGLSFNQTKYHLTDICVAYYFTEIDTLDSVFSEAIDFVKHYVNNPDTNDQECKILDFSFDTGEFLVSILDRHKSPVVRVFSFEIDFDSDNDIQSLKYYGEVTADMIDNKSINK